jgi:hypothetical protein
VIELLPIIAAKKVALILRCTGILSLLILQISDYSSWCIITLCELHAKASDSDTYAGVSRSGRISGR